jgi:SAM-dependent methyltransferase
VKDRKRAPQTAPAGSPRERALVDTSPRVGTVESEAGVERPSQPLGRRPLFVAAIALSAFLLFTLELLAGREVLPVFGGTPGVWATALFFFSTMLLLGYAYAHLLVVRLGLLRGGLVHLAVGAILAVLAILAPSHVPDLRSTGLPEALNVALALLMVAGAPAFLFAATTPLLSAWYARVEGDAWWLYAASNAASFAALLAYPVLLEPFTAMSTQRIGLLAGLVLFLVALGAIVAVVRSKMTSADTGTPASPAASSLGWRRPAWWFAAALIPAGLLTATTNYVTTDLVSAPLLWVGPLAIYLASFVVAFSARGRRILPFIDLLVPAAATLLWLPFVAPGNWPVIPLLLVELGSFAVLAIAVHGRLALDRPDAQHLTLFYLVLSAAGMCATAFVAIVAPIAFPDVYEYPLLLVLGVAVLALLWPATTRWLPDLRDRLSTARALVVRLVPYVLVGALLVVFAVPDLLVRLLAVGLIVVAMAATPRLLALVTPVVLVATMLTLSAGEAGSTTQLFQGRSFFGVSQVLNSGNVNALYSGTTLHGMQFLDSPTERATTYYVEAGPLGDVFAELRARTNGADIGAVGLGSGTVASYGRKGDSLTFFEIDPLMIRLAYDVRYFTFLRGSAIAPTTVEGDGRLSLEAEPDASFDLLVLDAFSSDSVPPHLLTREALATYLRTLRPGGIAAFNVSNRYYDLASAVGATARSLGLDAFGKGYKSDDQAIEQYGAADSLWVVVGGPADVARFLGYGWTPVVAGGPVLTDDFPDIIRVLRLAP